MRWLSFSFFLLFPFPLHAESVIATRTIRAQTLLEATDMAMVDAAIPGALENVQSAIGQETRVTLYAGRAIRLADIGPPAMVDRNQIVILQYNAGGLGIRTEGRALARGGAGDVIRVMNLSSKTTISGRILPDGIVQVGHTP